VVWDLETSGLNEPIHILEFGCIVIDRKTLQEVHRFETKVRLPEGGRVEEGARRIHGLDGKDGMPFADVADRIHALLDGQIWVGHNLAKFDVPVLQLYYSQNDLPAPQPCKVIDTVLLSRETLKDQRSHRLVDLARRFGLGEQTHRAAGDCDQTAQLLQRLAVHRLIDSVLGA